MSPLKKPYTREAAIASKLAPTGDRRLSRRVRSAFLSKDARRFGRHAYEQLTQFIELVLHTFGRRGDHQGGGH